MGRPGEATVKDREGRVVDEEPLSDVGNITDVRWEPFHVLLYYRRGTRLYEKTLDLKQ